jgi:hypothetical protein
MRPDAACIRMPPTAPVIPPMPATEPTARRGNMSEVSVNRLAEKPWWAAAARPIRPTAAHMSGTTGASDTGTTHNAHASRAVLRAAFVVQPRFSSADDSQPPATEPTSARR